MNFTNKSHWFVYLIRGIAIVCGCCFITVQAAAYAHVHESEHSDKGALVEHSGEHCSLCTVVHTQAVVSDVLPATTCVVLHVLPQPRYVERLPITAIIESISRGPPTA